MHANVRMRESLRSCLRPRESKGYSAELCRVNSTLCLFEASTVVLGGGDEELLDRKMRRDAGGQQTNLDWRRPKTASALAGFRERNFNHYVHADGFAVQLCRLVSLRANDLQR